VISNPQFDTSHFSGPVRIAGAFTAKEAAALAEKIRAARRQVRAR
jgi:hypothetical protein